MREILVILLILFLPSLGYSDEYVLVMSKDDKVCQHMLKIYNQDLKDFGDREINFEQHEEFKAIRWEKKDYSWKIYLSYTGILQVAKFDINNDGKREIVLKQGDKGLKGEPSDQIYIFHEKDIDTSGDEIVFTEELTNEAIDILGGALGRGRAFKANVYTLKELPVFEILNINGKELPIRYSLGGWFHFHPFLYNGKYFTSMHDWFPGIETKWEVILQYNKENELRDICYFLRAGSSKKD